MINESPAQTGEKNQGFFMEGNLLRSQLTAFAPLVNHSSALNLIQRGSRSLILCPGRLGHVRKMSMKFTENMSK